MIVRAAAEEQRGDENVDRGAHVRLGVRETAISYQLSAIRYRDQRLLKQRRSERSTESESFEMRCTCSLRSVIQAGIEDAA